MRSKKTRLISALLILVFAFSFLSSALAFEDMNPPLWEREGFSSLEEYLQYYYISEEQYAQWVENERPYYDWLDEYIAQHPDYEQEALDAEMWKLFGIESEEEFRMIFSHLSDEEINELLINEYLFDIYYKEMMAREKAETRISMGGTAEGLGVMFMGEYVKFPDAQPEIRNDRTMVPVRAVMELIGAEVEYDDDSEGISLVLENGSAVYFEIGKTEVALKSEDEDTTLQMDVAPYINDSRTYVPLRFFSEILGYDVFWDEYYYTAVVVDRDKLVSELNAQLSIVNGMLLDRQRDLDKNYASTVDVKADITKLDSIDGDKNVEASLSMRAIIDAENIDITGNLDIAELVVMIEESLGTDLGLKTDALENADFDIIISIARELAFLRSSLLVGENIYGEVVKENTWIETLLPPMGDVEAYSTMTLGDLVYDGIPQQYGAIFFVKQFGGAADTLLKVVGDDKFIISGAEKKRIITEDIIKEIFDEESFSYYLEEFETLDFEIVLSSSGKSSGFVEVKTKGNLYTPKIQLSTKFSEDKTSSSASMDLHIMNQLKVALTMTSKTAETTSEPRKSPPADAHIIG